MGVGGRLAGALLRLIGWRPVLVPPPRPHSVIIAYPHTSNWDFVVGMLGRAAIELRCHFAAKDTLFRGPFGAWLRRIGGIPVNRRAPTGFVGQLAREFERRAEFHIVFTPEGTRTKTEYWKTGFYRLALAARVPLGLAFIDYARREVGVGGWLDLSGNQAADLDRIRAFYAGKQGRRQALAWTDPVPAHERTR
jgi:1-acyl-sn-glycerol-3-phosphate acyltransferase